MRIHKFNRLFYKHPTYTWLWFAEPDEESKGFPIVYSSKIIPENGNVFIDTGEPQLELKGMIIVYKKSKTKMITSCNRGISYKINAHTALFEAKENKSEKRLKKRHPYVDRYPMRKITVADRTAFLNSLVTFDTTTTPDPLRTDGYELFDFSLPEFYKPKKIKDWDKIKEVSPNVWSVKIGTKLIGGFDCPEHAYQYYLQLNLQLNKR